MDAAILLEQIQALQRSLMALDAKVDGMNGGGSDVADRLAKLEEDYSQCQQQLATLSSTPPPVVERILEAEAREAEANADAAEANAEVQEALAEAMTEPLPEPIAQVTEESLEEETTDEEIAEIPSEPASESAAEKSRPNWLERLLTLQ